MPIQETVESIRSRFRILSPHMDEKAIRLWTATEARSAGWGGVTLVHKATGISRVTITSGMKELKSGKTAPGVTGRVRRSGGGRKPITETDPGIMKSLERLVEPVTRGDPMRPLRWVCKSTRQLADELTAQGHPISYHKVGELLHDMGYSLQGNCKTKEGTNHPDRNAQFEYINQQVMEFQAAGQPVISVDTKKKELIGDFKNAGKEWRPEGQPEEVQVHDFEYKDLGKGIPYGVYDVGANQGWVSVGTDHDTAEFAVATIEQWWKRMGKPTYPNATRLLITADSGGSNASRNKLWKVELGKLAETTGLEITVAHLPPGTSKWNKIEHRMFSQITRNWRGRPLLSHQVMVNLIGNTTTRTGLKIKASLDNRTYETGIQISKAALEAVKLRRHEFHGEWNYTMTP